MTAMEILSNWSLILPMKNCNRLVDYRKIIVSMSITPSNWVALYWLKIHFCHRWQPKEHSPWSKRNIYLKGSNGRISLTYQTLILLALLKEGAMAFYPFLMMFVVQAITIHIPCCPICCCPICWCSTWVVGGGGGGGLPQAPYFHRALNSFLTLIRFFFFFYFLL